MRNAPAPYKHDNPNHLAFGKSADSALLAKRRQNFDDGGLAAVSAPRPKYTSVPEEERQPTAADFTPEDMRPGGVAKMAAKYPGWPTMSISPEIESHSRKKSAYERTNPDWG